MGNEQKWGANKMYTKSHFISDYPRAAFVLATKELIDCLLQMNINNRNVRESHVKYLQREVILGKFFMTNNGIGINKNGDLIDGQHRLLALKRAGYPQVYILIVWGLPLESASAIDLGVKRSMADIMHLAFEHPEITSHMTGVCRFYGFITSKTLSKSGFKPSPNDIYEWYQKLSPAFDQIYQIKNITKLPVPVITAVSMQLVAGEDSRPLDFLDGLLTGANLDVDSPILKLKNYLALKSRGSGQIEQVERFKRTSAALVAFLENRKITKLYARQNPEKLLGRIYA